MHQTWLTIKVIVNLKVNMTDWWLSAFNFNSFALVTTDLMSSSLSNKILCSIHTKFDFLNISEENEFMFL